MSDIQFVTRPWKQTWIDAPIEFVEFFLRETTGLIELFETELLAPQLRA